MLMNREYARTIEIVRESATMGEVAYKRTAAARAFAGFHCVFVARGDGE